MARKIAKGNCHKKEATKKAAKQFIVAAPRYSILWLSGKHIHIHMQTYTHIRAHSSTLRAVHTPMHFYCSILLCAAKTIFVILPARGFRCFLRSFLSLHTQTGQQGVCVLCCARCPFVWGIRIKNYAVLVATNAKQVNPEMSPLPPHSVGFILFPTHNVGIISYTTRS